MNQENSSAGIFELSPDRKEGAHTKRILRFRHFPVPLLVYNAKWFCNLRWGVVLAFILFAIIGLNPNAVTKYIGFELHSGWPLVLAGILIVMNLGYLAHIAHIGDRITLKKISLNLWLQIVLDLTLLTVVIYYVGGLVHYLPLVYILHIILSCVFFRSSRSLMVTFLSILLYTTCLAFQYYKHEPLSILTAFSHADGPYWMRIAINVSSIFFIWLCIWYLTAHLSELLLAKYYELTRTNELLVKTQKERMKHLLRTTHELKAPFAAIHANLQLLLKGYCGTLTQDSHVVVVSTAARARYLSGLIQDMLQLTNLTSDVQGSLKIAELDISRVFRRALDLMMPLAEERSVKVEVELQPVVTRHVEDHLMMFFTNLLSNAIVYSQTGGIVHVRCSAEKAGSMAHVVIEDHGIGIPPEKLPRIFEEFYRTETASVHNKSSTGLGLAIVRQIAQLHHIAIRVESTPGVGTKFFSQIPLTGVQMTMNRNIS